MVEEEPFMQGCLVGEVSEDEGRVEAAARILADVLAACDHILDDNSSLPEWVPDQVGGVFGLAKEAYAAEPILVTATEAPTDVGFLVCQGSDARNRQMPEDLSNLYSSRAAGTSLLGQYMNAYRLACVGTAPASDEAKMLVGIHELSHALDYVNGMLLFDPNNPSWGRVSQGSTELRAFTLESLAARAMDDGDADDWWEDVIGRAVLTEIEPTGRKVFDEKLVVSAGRELPLPPPGTVIRDLMLQGMADQVATIVQVLSLEKQLRILGYNPDNIAAMVGDFYSDHQLEFPRMSREWEDAD